MKRKSLLILLSIFISFSLFAASENSDLKKRAMSLYGVADCFSTINYFPNPASLYHYNQATKFIASSGYYDNNERNPELYLKTQFTGKKIAFSIDVDINAEHNQIPKGQKVVYDVKRDVVFNFDASAGYKDFAAGIGIYGGSSMIQKNVNSLINQSLIGSYERLEESQFVSICIGALYKYDNLSFGLIADNILSYTGSEQKLSMDKALDFVSAGVFWAQDKYLKRGRLNKWVFNAGAEIQNLFNKDERAVAMGGDVTLQLTGDYSVSMRTGLTTYTSRNKSLYQSVGIGAKMNMIDVSAYAGFPLNKSQNTTGKGFIIGFNISYER